MIRRSTLVVIVVFALLLGLMAYLQNRQAEAPEATPTSGPEPIIKLELADLAGLRILSQDGSIFYATRDASGTWTLIQPSIKGDLNSSTIDANVTQLIDLRPLTSLDAVTGLEAVGLLTPDYVIRLLLVDGSEVVLKIGDETPTQSGYYVQVDNSEVVVAQSFAIQAVFGMLDNLPFQPTPTPEFTETPIAADSSSTTPTPTP